MPLDCFPPDLQALRAFAPHVATASSNSSDYKGALGLEETIWGPGNDCCSWEGISCTTSSAAQSPRVSALSLSIFRFSDVSSTTHFLQPLCNLSLLSSLYLDSTAVPSPYISPSLPACLGHLSALRNLSLIDLNLQGTLPSSFSRFLDLQYLDLRGNSLAGSLLPISNLPNLMHFDLTGNGFSGPLPPFHNPLLQYLDLRQNSLSGSLPPFHTPLLQYLDLRYNSLSGSLLPISSLPNLMYVDLTGNGFSGPLPPFHNPLLQYLDLQVNSLSGPLPPFHTPLLQYLDLGGNSLSEEIPRSICKLASLVHLDLSGNAFIITSLDSLECKFVNLTYLGLAALGVGRSIGPFPRWISRSPSLQTLILAENHFQGPLPDEWKSLRVLEVLYLSGNSVLPSQTYDGARLPDWLFHFPLKSLELDSYGLQTQDLLCSSKLSLLNQSLSSLSLRDNHLTGRDTLECFALYNFSQPIVLDLSGNPLSLVLSNVLLPPLVSSLDLGSCNLHGRVPEASFSSSLYQLRFTNNNLSGILPAQMFNSSQSVISVDFSHNHFTGIDPQLITVSVQFASVDLSHNALAMDLPSLLANIGLKNIDCDPLNPAMSAQHIDLSYNALVGEIPAFLGLCKKDLISIKIDNNKLVGHIPNELAGLANLDTLTLNNNILVGHIPDELAGLAYLETLTLNNNRLEGTIPASIIGMSSLTLLDLSYNDLEGNLSTLFSFSGTRSYLRAVLLSHNRISGSIPLSFGISMPNLQLIDFSNNRLTGIIPQKLHLPYFQNLEATNKIGAKNIPISATGKLYEEVPLVVKGVEWQYSYVLEAMTALDLSGNNLEGEIPGEMGNLAGLLFLNLSHNKLSGSIPSTLGKLSQLQSLDLSFNQLEGPLPSQLSNLTKLAVFNVSFNPGLSGSIPQGPQFEMTESYKEDPHLCGSPTLQDCKPAASSRVDNVPQYTTDLQQQPGGSIIARWIDEWIALPGLGLGIVVGVGATLFLLHYKH